MVNFFFDHPISSYTAQQRLPTGLHPQSLSIPSHAPPPLNHPQPPFPFLNSFQDDLIFTSIHPATQPSPPLKTAFHPSVPPPYSTPHPYCQGVTTVVDAGSTGALTYPGLKHYVMEQAQTRVFALLHIACHGLSGAGCSGPDFDVGIGAVLSYGRVWSVVAWMCRKSS